MVRILKKKHCLWRNIYAPRPVFYARLALDEAASWRAESLSQALLEILRTKLDGFAVDPNSDAAQLVAETAQRFQLVGDVTPAVCGVHSRDAEKNEATLFFAAMDPFLAELSLLYTVQMASAFAGSAIGEAALIGALDRCLERLANAALDQTTRLMIEEAERRDIPWFRVSAMTRHVQLGQGERLRRIFETLRTLESPIGLDLSRDKLLTFHVLGQLQLPVGRFSPVRDVETAIAAAAKIGYPIVLKPVQGKKGRRVFANIRNAEELRAIIERIGDVRHFLLQSFFPGDDHRILIVDGKFVAAARRIPAGVTGDGQRTIAQLVEDANRDPRRGTGFTKLMNRIALDAEAERILRAQTRSKDSIPAAGEYVRLRSTANVSTGGTAIDVTGIIHPDNVRAAVRAARALELTVAGVDFISPDISRSWREAGGGICEVNSIVGLRPHQLASPDIDVAGPLIETIYPARSNGRIPTAMITGTKGKSTTTKMLCAMLASAGHTVGGVTTDGVTIGGEEVAIGDYAGNTGAVIVMREPTVTAAALEAARGGLIKGGMYLDWCNVAALTNVSREQVGIDGINTVEDMAALKRKVLEAARDAVVLNADNQYCLEMVPDFAKRLRMILFSMDPACEPIGAHITAGGHAFVLNGTVIEMRTNADCVPLIDIADMPSTMNGVIRINAANAMAAAGLALGLGVSFEHMREGLRRYDNSLESSGCRFTLVNGFPFKIMFDRAAQAEALVNVMPVVASFPVTGKRICVLSKAGNRPDWSFREAASAVAGNFDHYLCFDRLRYRRGRKPGEIANTLAQALKEANIGPECISVAETTEEAASALFRMAAPDDFAVVFCAEAHGFVEKFRAALSPGKGT
ncbi:MAG: Mur ligase family protein [Alphaproteobacteria bacterium]